MNPITPLCRAAIALLFVSLALPVLAAKPATPSKEAQNAALAFCRQEVLATLPANAGNSAYERLFGKCIQQRLYPDLPPAGTR